ncbi:hypothetical protein HDU81_009208, partial [Chytriomyces hyalinus]
MAESTVLQPRTDCAANSQQQPPNAPVGPFKTSVAMAVRDFIRQQATPRQPVEINSASVDEFKEAVCLMARSHVIREVVVCWVCFEQATNSNEAEERDARLT